MIEFKRNEETGIVEVWKNGKKTGEIRTMGDDILGNGADEQRGANTGKGQK